MKGTDFLIMIISVPMMVLLDFAISAFKERNIAELLWFSFPLIMGGCVIAILLYSGGY